ncbi:MAG: CoA ester lyase [Clostridiaceae bacterium]|jgi:citrate lyase subunit beta/citryl-CoA lyase|nr:CoA ester lyase [Clostridiaceae bacterium]
MRRSLLFLPGNQPGMLQSGGVLPADTLIFDLEDSVAAGEKDAARELVASALRSFDFGRRELSARINDLETKHAFTDLKTLIPAGIETIMLPKVSGGDMVQQVAALFDEIELEHGIVKGRIKIIALIETACGVEHAYEVAVASPRVVALALGAEDLAADLGCARTKEGREIFYSRSRLIIAAKAAGIEALDTPFTDARDTEGCYEDALFARSLGYAGKLCISPHHLDSIHRAFMPSKAEIEFALEVTEAMRRAKEDKRGAVSLRGKMIDLPVLLQAERTLHLARAAGLIQEEPDGENNHEA